MCLNRCKSLALCMLCLTSEKWRLFISYTAIIRQTTGCNYICVCVCVCVGGRGNNTSLNVCSLCWSCLMLIWIQWTLKWFRSRFRDERVSTVSNESILVITQNICIFFLSISWYVDAPPLHIIIIESKRISYCVPFLFISWRSHKFRLSASKALLLLLLC